MLLLDEFQTWYDGLTNTKQYPWKNWAFNFIQILSEIAKEHPELLVLVISVRNGGSDAYQQVHRVNPVAIDFYGGLEPRTGSSTTAVGCCCIACSPNRSADRQVSSNPPRGLIEANGSELALMEVPAAEPSKRKRNRFLVSWPVALHWLRLLEEQVLIATNAQPKPRDAPSASSPTSTRAVGSGPGAHGCGLQT